MINLRDLPLHDAFVIVFPFTAIFAALGISGWGADFRSTLCVVTGVFLGSAIWAPIFATGVPHFHLELNKRHFSYLNRLTGTIITAVGIFFAGMGILNPSLT